MIPHLSSALAEWRYNSFILSKETEAQFLKTHIRKGKKCTRSYWYNKPGLSKSRHHGPLSLDGIQH